MLALSWHNIIHADFFIFRYALLRAIIAAFLSMFLPAIYAYAYAIRFALYAAMPPPDFQRQLLCYSFSPRLMLAMPSPSFDYCH